ncbi:MAG: hypothetical protein HEQ20_03965 [Aphanizomenon flos-aquae KM1D3_PB]|nr:MAG: hypothetical protein HEQ20_03965 [Aphanizomenon flos-aquae KM1D3_PB]
MPKKNKLLDAGSKCRAYIIEQFKVIKTQLDFVNSLLEMIVNEQEDEGKSAKLIEKETEHNRNLFCHILASTTSNIKKKKTAWIPISSRFREKYLSHSCYQKFEDAGLLEVRDYSHYRGLSREFKIPDVIIDEFFQLGDISSEEYVEQDKYNLFDGKKSNKIIGHQKHDKNKNAEPKLIRGALDLIQEGYFNKTAVEAHLAELKSVRDSLKIEYENTESDPFASELEKHRAFKKYETARCRWLNDNYCLKAVLNQRIRAINKDIWIFRPAYKVQTSGRVSPFSGGLQSCSRRAKAAAYKDIENLRNYDLKSSQIAGLIQEFELENLDTSWLIAYRNNPNAKKEYAAKVGISVDCWKTCLCSLLFGASLNTPSKAKSKLDSLSEMNGKSINSVLDNLSAEANYDVELAIEYFNKFYKVVKPLEKELKKWHKRLLEWAEADKNKKKESNGKFYVKNCVEKKLCLTDLQDFNEWEIKSKLASFVLLGRESCFIHHLTILSKEYNYQVIANEHDGLVVLGTIPKEAVLKAAEGSGLKDPILEEKPFDTTEIEDLLDSYDFENDYDWDEISL